MGTDPTLRIRGVETHPVLVPMSRPVRTATGTITEAPLLLIDLHTEEGVTGHAYLFGYQTLTLRPLGDLVQAMAGMVRGRAVAPVELDHALRARFQEVSAHLLAVSPTADWLEYMNLTDPVLREPLVPVDGALAPADRPGIGLEWDPEGCARFAVE